MEDMKNGLIMILNNSSQQALPRPSGAAQAAAPMLAHRLATSTVPAWLRNQEGRQHLFILKSASSLEVLRASYIIKA